MSESNYKRVVRLLLAILVIVLLSLTLYLLLDILIIIAIATLLSFIFAPFVALLEARGMNRLTSTLTVFAVFGLLFYLALSVFIPKLIYQMDQLMTALKDFSFEDEMKTFEAGIIKYLPFLQAGEITERVKNFISTQVLDLFEILSQVLSSVVSVIAILVIVPFITFFLLKDYRRILIGILQVIPNKYFEMSYWVLKKVSLRLGMFVRAWIFDATFVGFVIGFGFYGIGIPNALPLGVAAGLGHLIPYFGPIIGGVPAIIVSFIQYGDLSQVPAIILVVALTYTLDNGFVQPYIFGKSVDMHPVAIILLIISGGTLFGLIGILLAVPLATVIKTFAKEIYFAKKNYKIAKV